MVQQECREALGRKATRRPAHLESQNQVLSPTPRRLRLRQSFWSNFVESCKMWSGRFRATLSDVPFSCSWSLREVFPLCQFAWAFALAPCRFGSGECTGASTLQSMWSRTAEPAGAGRMCAAWSVDWHVRIPLLAALLLSAKCIAVIFTPSELSGCETSTQEIHRKGPPDGHPLLYVF